MKKILRLTLAIILIFGGCTSIEYIPAYELALGLDLRPYAEENFLITPYEYLGKYTSIAVIDYKIMPEATLITTEKMTSSGVVTTSTWQVDTVMSAEALNKIFIMCKDMGANALVDFKIFEASDNYSNIKKPVIVAGIRISGLAIKREN